AGRGAGRLRAALAVLSDGMELSPTTLGRAPAPLPLRSFRSLTDRPMREPGALRCRYYLRFTVIDRPGVLAQLAGILGDHQISLRQVVQEGAEDPDKPVTVVMLTHVATEAQVREALAIIDKLPTVARKTCLIRLGD